MNPRTHALRGSLSASDTLPVELPEDVDIELVDLLCDDVGWLDETFREIVATSWAEPPRGGTARPAAHPRRFRPSERRAPRHDGGSRSQWCPRPQRRQRSPPRIG